MDPDRQHLRDLLRTHQSQLRVLELQAAKLGDYTPPHVLTEIDRLTAAIASIETQLGQPMPAVSRAALRPYAATSLPMMGAVVLLRWLVCSVVLLHCFV
jgi:hypothetical protein